MKNESVSLEDPFADPFADSPEHSTMPVPKHVQILSPITSVNMPESVFPFDEVLALSDISIHWFYRAEPSPAIEQHEEHEEPAYRGSMPVPISFPLPPMHEVIQKNRGMRDMPSSYTLGDMSRQTTNTDWVQPATE